MCCRKKKSNIIRRDVVKVLFAEPSDASRASYRHPFRIYAQPNTRTLPFVFDNLTDCRCAVDNVNLMHSRFDELMKVFRYATILYNAGVGDKDAQTLLGHSTIAMTRDIYTHISDKQKEATRSKLSSFICSNNSQAQ